MTRREVTAAAGADPAVGVRGQIELAQLDAAHEQARQDMVTLYWNSFAPELGQQGQEGDARVAAPSESSALFGSKGEELAYRVRRTVSGGAFVDLTADAVWQHECRVASSVAYEGSDVPDVSDLDYLPKRGCAPGELEPVMNYFGLYDPAGQAENFVVLPSTHPAVERELVRLDAADRRERRAGHLDKVAQRNRAEAIGEFLQPHHLDIRFLQTDGELQIVDFVRPDLSTIPTSRILAAMKTQQTRWVFENPHDGFVIDAGPEGISISSGNATVRRAAALAMQESDPEGQLSVFIEALAKERFSLSKISSGRKGSDLLGPEELQRRLGLHQGVVYLKSTRSAGGYLVVRIDCDGQGGVKLSSDSKEFEEFRAGAATTHLRRMQNCETSVSRLKQLKAQPELIAEEEARLARLRGANADGVILAALLCSHELHRPILEEAIPTVRVKGEMGEFRMICQENERGRLQVVASYAKVSDNQTAANIALGGRGVRVADWMREIFADKLPGLSDGRREQLVAKAERDLERRTARFVRKYAALTRGVKEPIKDCAVDICPVWNTEKGGLDFYFLELQKSYGFSGLQECDPERAEVVGANRARLLPAENRERVLMRPEGRLFYAIFGGRSPKRDSGVE